MGRALLVGQPANTRAASVLVSSQFVGKPVVRCGISIATLRAMTLDSPDVSRVPSTPRRKNATRTETVVLDLAASQYGVVATWQLVQYDVPSVQITRWAHRGWLVRLHRGVYAVGHRSLTPDGHHLAAVLACGPGAVLSHRSAADAWGLRATSRSRVDVTTARAGGRRQARIDAHQSSLHPDDRTILRGIPITTVARTALDLGEVTTQRAVHRFLVAAEQQRRYDQRAIDAVVARAAGRRGLRPLLGALRDLHPEHVATRSEMEIRALELIAAHGLPAPRVNDALGAHLIDLHWPDRRVAVELDSRTFHLTADAFERDRRRDAELAAAGYRAARITWLQLTREPAWVARTLARLLA